MGAEPSLLIALLNASILGLGWQGNGGKGMILGGGSRSGSISADSFASILLLSAAILDLGGWQGNGGKGMILRGGSRSGSISADSFASIPLPSAAILGDQGGWHGNGGKGMNFWRKKWEKDPWLLIPLFNFTSHGRSKSVVTLVVTMGLGTPGRRVAGPISRMPLHEELMRQSLMTVLFQ